MPPRSNLIIAAHHDDAEFGCGGIIARYGGSELFHVAIVCHGRGFVPSEAEDPGRDKRETETELAFSRHLPVNSVNFLRLIAETEGNRADLGAIADAVRRYLSATKATDLYLPLRGFNQDHQAVHQACLIALRPVEELPSPLRVWAYEYPGDVWGAGEQPPTWGARHTALSPDQIERKCAALREHSSQFDHRPGILIGPNGARRLSEHRGASTGCEFAETHYLLREVCP